MIRWALIFLVISLVSGLFGFTGIAAGSAAIAKVLFFIALTMFLIFVVAGVVLEKKLAGKL
jgi:uncharacterized membrane protein YtjA (UPF0391 family)